MALGGSDDKLVTRWVVDTDGAVKSVDELYKKVKRQELEDRKWTKVQQHLTGQTKKLVASQDRMNKSLLATKAAMTGSILKAQLYGKAMSVLGTAYGEVLTQAKEFPGVLKNYSGNIELARRATKGLVSDLELMKARNEAVLLGVKLSNEEWASMLKAVTKVANATGKSVPFALNSAVTAMARQSKLMADNIGVIISAEEANENYAKSVGKTVEQLTDLEKKKAFQEEFVRKLQTNAQKLANVHLTLSQQVGSSMNSIVSYYAKSIGEIDQYIGDWLSSPRTRGYMAMMKSFFSFGTLGDAIHEGRVAEMKAAIDRFAQVGGERPIPKKSPASLRAGWKERAPSKKRYRWEDGELVRDRVRSISVATENVFAQDPKMPTGEEVMEAKRRETEAAWMQKSFDRKEELINKELEVELNAHRRRAKWREEEKKDNDEKIKENMKVAQSYATSVSGMVSSLTHAAMASRSVGDFAVRASKMALGAVLQGVAKEAGIKSALAFAEGIWPPNPAALAKGAALAAVAGMAGAGGMAIASSASGPTGSSVGVSVKKEYKSASTVFQGSSAPGLTRSGSGGGMLTADSGGAKAFHLRYYGSQWQRMSAGDQLSTISDISSRLPMTRAIINPAGQAYKRRHQTTGVSSNIAAKMGLSMGLTPVSRTSGPDYAQISTLAGLYNNAIRSKEFMRGVESDIADHNARVALVSGEIGSANPMLSAMGLTKRTGSPYAGRNLQAETAQYRAKYRSKMMDFGAGQIFWTPEAGLATMADGGPADASGNRRMGDYMAPVLRTNEKNRPVVNFDAGSVVLQIDSGDIAAAVIAERKLTARMKRNLGK